MSCCLISALTQKLLPRTSGTDKKGLNIFFGETTGFFIKMIVADALPQGVFIDRFGIFEFNENIFGFRVPDAVSQTFLLFRSPFGGLFSEQQNIISNLNY